MENLKRFLWCAACTPGAAVDLGLCRRHLEQRHRRWRWALVAGLLLGYAVSALAAPAHAVTCGTLCKDEIALHCPTDPHPRDCRRALLRDCRLDPRTCGGLSTTTTTTTSSTTTTTVRWVLGATVPQSCDAACAAKGLRCDLVATRDVVGSGGTSAACQAMVEALDPARTVTPYPDADLTACGPDLAVGCETGPDLFHPADDVALRITAPVTTCEADGVSPLCDSLLRRVCACR